MKVLHHEVSDDTLLNPLNPAWKKATAEAFDMNPAPIAMAAKLSPFMALSEDHGSVEKLEARAIHNGKRLSLLISWADDTADTKIDDLNQFTDGVAVMFPMSAGATATTMGDENNPVNAWMWKADAPEPMDVIARGYGSSQRRSAQKTGLKASAVHTDGRWHVVFQRNLRPSTMAMDLVGFSPKSSTGIAIAVWNGSNNERAGQKSVSGEWAPFEVVA